MKKYSVTVLFFFLASAITAQTFEKTYGDTSGNTGYYFLQANDSGFYVMSVYQDIYTQQVNLQLMKTNQYGDSISSIIPQLPGGRGGKVCTNTKDNFAVTSSIDYMIGQNQYIDTLFVTRIDTNGNTISTWNYPDTIDLSSTTLIETSDGGYLLGIGAWNYPYISQVLLMKLDSAGSIEWKEFVLPYSSGAGEDVQDLIETVDHHFIIEVQQSSGSMWTGSKLMVKVDTLGNILWTTTLTYGYPGGGVHQMIATDTGYIYLDNIGYSMSSPEASRISLVDTAGVLGWSKILYPGSFYNEIIQSPQKEFYLVERNFQQDITITKLDQQLDSVSSEYFGFPGKDEFVNYFTQLPDERLACLGYAKSGTSIQTADIYFLVCDSMLVINQTEISSMYSELVLYPNPTSGKLAIGNTDPYRKAISAIEIYNTLGKQVSNWSQNRGLTGEKEIQIDLASLPPGIYFLEATSGEKIWRGKVIKE